MITTIYFPAVKHTSKSHKDTAQCAYVLLFSFLLFYKSCNLIIDSVNWFLVDSAVISYVFCCVNICVPLDTVFVLCQISWHIQAHIHAHIDRSQYAIRKNRFGSSTIQKSIIRFICQCLRYNCKSNTQNHNWLRVCTNKTVYFFSSSKENQLT